MVKEIPLRFFAMLSSTLDFLFPKPAKRREAELWLRGVGSGEIPMYPKYLHASMLRTWDLHALDKASALTEYDSAPYLRNLIWWMKYESRRGIAEEFGNVMARYFFPAEGSVLCPVPLHWSRRWSRGFNQCACLAEPLSRVHGIPVRHLLKRTRASGYQSHRKREERFSAVHELFTWCGEEVPRHVILIDDLLTTGATLDACAKVLKAAGVQRVEACVLALG